MWMASSVCTVMRSLLSVTLAVAVIAPPVCSQDDGTGWGGNIRELHWQRQWAIEATASSAYNETGGWSTDQLLGMPNTKGYGDIATAWAPKAANGGAEWIELTYEWPVIPDSIQVIQSCGAGAITRVQLQPLGGGEWMTVLEKPAQAVEASAPVIHVVDAKKFGQATRRVRVEIDTAAVPGWNEIDAVSLMGTYVIGPPGSGYSTGAYRLWAEGATASSTWRNAEPGGPYGALQICGVPNSVFGRDTSSAWLAEKDGGMEWIEVYYSWPVVPTEMHIYENCGPGAVRKIEAQDELTGEWKTIWEGIDPTVEPGVFSLQLNVDFPAHIYRISLDTAVPGWNELDAVQLVGSPREQ